MADDPYTWPGSDCLKNLLGIKNTEELAVAEGQIVSVRDVEVSSSSIPGDYNTEHLKKFHRALFRDVYEWAGNFQTVDISKDDSRFCHWRFVDDQVDAVLAVPRDEGFYVGFRRDAFVHSLATLYGHIVRG